MNSPAERNQSLEALRGKGLCSDAQIAYGIGFGIMLAVRLYWWSVLRKYVQKLSTAVPYPIAFDQNQIPRGPTSKVNPRPVCGNFYFVAIMYV